MDELLLSGYCRQLDQARTVLVELADDVWADCCYPDCEFASQCTIALEIDTNKTGGSR